MQANNQALSARGGPYRLRLRFAAAVTIATTLAYLFYDTAVAGTWMPVTFATQVTVIIVSLVVLVVPIARERVFDWAFAYCAVISAGIVVATSASMSAVSQTLPTVVVLGAVLVMGVAATFPWGAKRQAALALWNAGGLGAFYVVAARDAEVASPYVLVLAALLTVAASVLVAMQISVARHAAASRLAELRRSEAEARAIAERARMLTERLPAAVFAHDRDMVFREASGSLLRQLEFDADELVGTGLEGYLAREAPEFPMIPAVRSALAGKSVGFEATFRGRRLVVALEPLRNGAERPADGDGDSGEVTGTIGVALDVTDRANAERELVELNAHLEELVIERTAELGSVVKELESFGHAVSHDLRQPLRSVHSFVQILEAELDGSLDAHGRDCIDRVRRNAVRMNEMLDGLLSLSRLTGADIERTSVDLSSIARDVVADLRQAEPDRSVRVLIDGPLDVEGDPGLLRSMLQNILANSWKFTRNVDDPTVEVLSQPEGPDRVCIVVRDNGAGFSREQSAQLFRPFRRLHAEDEYEGTGIGLATVQRIVQRHGGRISINSQGPGHGAVVTLTLPRAPALIVDAPANDTRANDACERPNEIEARRIVNGNNGAATPAAEDRQMGHRPFKATEDFRNTA